MSDAGDTSSDPEGWNAVDLTGDPFLVVGRRRGQRIEAYRLDLHEDIFDDFRQVCDKARQLALTTRSRPYEPNAELESGEEHFDLMLVELAEPADGNPDEGRGDVVEPRRFGVVAGSVAGRPDGTGPDAESSVVTNLRRPDELSILSREEFEETRIVMYAVCWQQTDMTWVSFVRKTNPRQLFKPGRRWCQYSDSLKRIESTPSFVYDDQFDAIVKDDRVAGFSAVAMKNLFTDVGLALTEVPTYVSRAADRIGSTLPLSDKSQAALRSLGQRRVSVASRLYGLAARLDELAEAGELTAERYSEVAGDDEEAAKIIVDGEFDFDEEGAHVFLDVIEGRYFEDDWTGNLRRADRWSKRR